MTASSPRAVMKRMISAPTRKVLRLLGKEIVPSRDPSAGAASSMDAREAFAEIGGDCLEALYADCGIALHHHDAGYDYLRPYFYVDLEMVRNPLGFGFAETGWHCFTALLKQYKRMGKKLTYRNSVLKEFYDGYRPGTIGDVFHIDSAESPLLSLDMAGFFMLPWNVAYVFARDKDWHYSGPMDDEEGSLHFRRAIEVYESIRRGGYRPYEVNKQLHDVYPRGYFLKNDDRYRFVLGGGSHRVAALSQLGFGKVPVMFRDSHPRVIDIRDIHEWPQVRRKQISPADAHRVFMHFFAETPRLDIAP